MHSSRHLQSILPTSLFSNFSSFLLRNSFSNLPQEFLMFFLRYFINTHIFILSLYPLFSIISTFFMARYTSRHKKTSYAFSELRKTTRTVNRKRSRKSKSSKERDEARLTKYRLEVCRHFIVGLLVCLPVSFETGRPSWETGALIAT